MKRKTETDSTSVTVATDEPCDGIPVVTAELVTQEEDHPIICENDTPSWIGHPTPTDPSPTASHVTTLINKDHDKVNLEVTPTAVLVNNQQQVTSRNATGATFIPSVDHQQRRAEFISVTLLEKPAELGIHMGRKRHGKRVRIVDMRPGSPLLESPIQTGDVLFSINGKPCSGLSPKQIRELLRSLNGKTVTIVARNRGGDSTLLETMVEKPTPDAGVGIHARKRGINLIKITGIAENSLLAGSLLVRLTVLVVTVLFGNDFSFLTVFAARYDAFRILATRFFPLIQSTANTFQPKMLWILCGAHQNMSLL